MNPRILFVLFGLVACEDGKLVFDDTGDDAWEEETMAILTTVSSDYATGGLATVDLRDGAVEDGLLTLSGDSVARVTEGQIVVLNRGTEDSVMLFAPGALSEPTLEFTVGDGANPQDAAMCGGALWVSLYGEDYLGAYDPETGAQLATVDLSAYDDGDGLPEAGSLVALDGTLYLALQQLDETTTYWSAVGGLVLAIDCETRTISDEWEAAPVPSLRPDPDTAGGLLVRTGAYFDAEGAFSWDGGLYALDPAAGSLTAIAPPESELSLNYTAIAPVAGGSALVVTTDESWLYSVHCLDRATGELTLLETLDSYVADVEVAPSGEAWLAARASWSAPEAPAGVLRYDVEACAPAGDGEPLTFSLEPYSLAFY